jgi:hypothetical protein
MSDTENKTTEAAPVTTDIQIVEKMPQITQYITSIEPYLKRIDALEITNQDTLDEGANIRVVVVKEQKGITNFFDMLITPLNLYIKGLKALRDRKLAIAAPGLEQLDSKIKAYHKRVQELIDQAAAKRADEERKLLAERDKKAQAIADKECKILADAIIKADKLIAQGKQSQADLILKQAQEESDKLFLERHELLGMKVEPKTQVMEMPKTSGVAIKTYWGAETDSMQKLIAYAHMSGDYAVLEPNTTELNKRARDKKGESPIPGVRYVSRQETAGVRSAPNGDMTIRDGLTGEVIPQ